MIIRGSLPMSQALRIRFSFSGLSGFVKSVSVPRNRLSSPNKSRNSCGGPPWNSCHINKGCKCTSPGNGHHGAWRQTLRVVHRHPQVNPRNRYRASRSLKMIGCQMLPWYMARLCISVDNNFDRKLLPGHGLRRQHSCEMRGQTDEKHL